MKNLIPVAENLWNATQPFSYLGLEVGIRMVIVRLNSGELLLISPIQLQASDCATLDALGLVSHLIAPNLFHHLFFGPAQSLYPEAKAWGVEGLAEKRPDLRLDGLLNQAGNFGPDLEYLPLEGFGALLPRGICLAHETVFWHRPSRSLILTDSSFHFDETFPWGTQLAARIMGSYKTLKPSYFEKLGSRDKAQVKASVRKVLAWDFDRVIMAHGSIVETDGKAQFTAGFEWLLGETL